MQHEHLAQELLRALRGERSQVAWSRRLGYRSNIAYPWESGRRYPNASEAMRAIERSGRDVSEGLVTFYGARPPWLDEVDPTSGDGIVRLLDDLRGSRTVTELAASAGVNRHALGRWLSGRTQPRLPDFLRVLEAASVRLPDFLASFVDPLALPSLAPVWEQIEARRQGAAEHPWTQALLRVVELEAYREHGEHDDAWVAQRLGVAPEVVGEGFAYLERSGQAVREHGQFVGNTRAVDTRRSPEVGRKLKAHWTDVAAERIRGGSPGQFSYNVFSVSEEDLERIRALHLAYFHALRSIVAESERNERVVVANVQLFALDADAEPC